MMNAQKHLFTLDEKVHYINCAYMSPMLKSVEDAGIRGLVRKRYPHKLAPEEFFTESEALRKLFASLIQAAHESISILPSVSYGMALVAKNLPCSAGQNIVIAHEQFPSNVYAWQKLAQQRNLQLRIVAPPEGAAADRSSKWNEYIIEAIDKQTALVALPVVHWADGTLFQLEQISKRVHECGGLLVVDGTQSIGALDFDVNVVKPDALICAGYKWMMGPYGLGLAYWGEAFSEGSPLEESWIVRQNSEDFSKLVQYEPNYQPVGIRFDVGEQSNFILLPMLTEGLRQILQWSTQYIQQYCEQLMHPFYEQLSEFGIYPGRPGERASHLVGIRLPASVSMERIKHELQKRNVLVSYRGDAIRISPHLYNDTADIAALQEAMDALLRARN